MHQINATVERDRCLKSLGHATSDDGCAELMSSHAGSDRIVRQKPGSATAFSTAQIVQSLDRAQPKEHL
ncbi:hypothetical protein BMJ29_02645 [Sinorhizobium medicae]|uniref:Uncharacterized protein n=1 Tax=Sinorhizobium medicae TaxID=110321 RepID=A0ABX4TE16_9HYPH|nr:hypothetical protein BMJ33_27800 [Sinorhizobium medicae]PLU24243.1 hypothetical protein BMJ29_02645 [Sinorhizobium medicae]PLU78020.1 hypothetical protein BMJ19_21075 [Sinorhizobium medicae]